MNQIIVSRTERGWMAEFRESEASEILTTRCSSILPTGFTAWAEEEIVTDEITRCNPGYVVTVGLEVVD
jgi:hypothetical protein